MFLFLKRRIFWTGLLLLCVSFKSQSNECRDAFDSLSKKENKSVQKLNNKYVQFVFKQGNHQIVSVFREKKELTGNVLKVKGVYYHPSARKIANVYSSYFDGNAITMEMAEGIFNQALTIEDISWENIQEGCGARAHLMSRKIESLGVYVDKVWIVGDLFTQKFGRYFIPWEFHVAPFVYVESKEGEIEKMVIDPALFGKPIPLEQWVDKLNGHQKKIVRTSYPAPFNSKEIGKISLAVSNSDAFDIVIHNTYLSEADKLILCNAQMDRLRE